MKKKIAKKRAAALGNMDNIREKQKQKYFINTCLESHEVDGKDRECLQYFLCCYSCYIQGE